jgi:hypothetical protein
MGALQALIPFAIITGALGVAGNLLGWIPVLTRGEVGAAQAAERTGARAGGRRMPATEGSRANVCGVPARVYANRSSAYRHSPGWPFDSLQRKRRVGDEWQYAMWQRDTAIKKEFK